MADSIDDIGFDSCETNPTPDPCPIPKPILQLDNGYGVQLCTPNGPITVHFQIPAAADDCPPDAPADPIIVGWTDDLSGAFTAAAAAPADAVPCGETADFETVRWCGLDADGEPVADILIEYEYDEDTRQLIGSTILNPEGTPYSGPAYVTIGRCNDVPLEYTTVSECRNGTIHSVTRSIDRDGIIIEVEAVDTGEICDQFAALTVDCPATDTPEPFAYELPEDAATEQSYGIGEVVAGEQGIKFDAAEPDLSPELAAAHDAIIACIAAGGVANTVITDQDGNTVELDLDTVVGDGNPQYVYTGNVIDGDPGGGKIRAMTVTCSVVDGDAQPALSVLGCLDEAILAKLCEIADQNDLEVDVEFVCNAETGVFDSILTTSVDGVVTGETVTATTISCDTEVFDYEQPVVCRDGERTLLLNQIAEDGTVTELAATPLGEPCPQAQVDCVESQEWTYGIDNTGTYFSYADATYEITLSDGSTLQWSQTAQASWTPQLQEWAAGIQAAADAAGLAWFVEPRAVNNPIPTDISGNYGNNPTGLPGAPSVPIAVALIDGGMVARYVNIQICPGQPVPVSANVVTVADQGTAPSAAADGFALNTAGAVLGPLQKFFVCRTCGVEPVWYLADGVTEAEAGQIPNCFEPCGTLALADAPPDRECDFFFDLGCDNVDQNDPNNFVQQITRRATVCNGEQISLDYFTEDPNDPTALVDYTLVGDFVDCDSGEPAEVPEPECSEFVLTDLFRVDPSTSTGALVANDYQLDADGHDPVSLEDSVADIAAWPVGTDSVPDPSTVGVLNAASPQSWSTLNTNDVENTAGVDNADVQIIAGFVAVESDLMFRYAGSFEGYTAVYLDACCATGAKALIYERSQNIGGPGEQGDASGVLPSGIHAISIINYDANGTNSAANFQHSTDGGVSWSNGFPGVSLSAVKPKQECLKVKVCVDTGALIDLLSGEVLDSADLSACPIECGVDPNTALLEEIRDLLGDDGECPCDDAGGLGDPIGDQTVCASRKLGADIVSNATGEATHTAGSLYDTNGPVDAWVGTFTVTDSAGATHVIEDGETVTGLASGSVQGVTFTGEVEWTDPAGPTTYRCPVTDKAISAGFVVQ